MLVKDIIQMEYLISNNIKYGSKILSYLYPSDDIEQGEYIRKINENITIDILIPILNILNKTLKNE